MSRFTEINDNVVETFIKIMETRFPYLSQLKIKLIFDTKRRIKEGKIVLAATELASEKIKYFSKDDVAIEGYDVVIIFDMKAWELANSADRERIMSHELRHIFIDDKDKIKLLPHDVSDFRAEMQLNVEDPDWAFRLATLTNDIYEQEKEMARQSKSLKENAYG
jgi:hypothetical protein